MERSRRARSNERAKRLDRERKSMSVVSTEVVRPHERFAYWREVVSQHFVHLRPELTADKNLFHGEIHSERIGDLPVSKVISGGQRVFRTQAEIARSPVP